MKHGKHNNRFRKGILLNILFFICLESIVWEVLEMFFDYYYGNEADQYSFYRIPKVMFTASRFAALSLEAKLLYGIMLDRMSLSVKNRWFDEKNRVYIIFTIQEIMQVMGYAEQKVSKLLAELDIPKGIGLIERKRQGLGKPNIIYVKNFITESQNQNCENHRLIILI
jgi:hypothetical protein